MYIFPPLASFWGVFPTICCLPKRAVDPESAFNFQEAKNVKKKLKNAWKLLIIVLKKYAKIQLKIKAEAQLSVLMGVNHSKLC